MQTLLNRAKAELEHSISGIRTGFLTAFGHRSRRWTIRRMSKCVHYDEINGCLKASNVMPMDMMLSLFLSLFLLAIIKTSYIVIV